MFKTIGRWFTALIIFLILAACSQENVLSPIAEEEYSLESVENGAIMEQGGSLTVTLSETGGRADSVRITLEDGEGRELAVSTVEPALLKGLGMPLDLPADLKSGVYTLRFRVLEGSILLHEETRYIFVADGQYQVKSLETYPPGIHPGDGINARVGISAPSGADPWLRWSLNGKILKEGLLSDAGILCSFNVPGKEGIYSLKVELFPVPPLDGQMSSAFRQSDLFVDGTEDGSSWSGNRVFRYFIDFSDALINKMAPEDLPEVKGDPSLWINGEMKGVLFDEDDGLLFRRYALDLLSGGRADDFILTMAFSYDSLPGRGRYNIISTGDGETSFAVYYDADRAEFVSAFQSYARAFQSALPAERLDQGDVLYLEIRYEGAVGVASLSWIREGETLVRDESLPVASLEEGMTLIGGGEKGPGLPMVWYSLGISAGDDDVHSSEEDLETVHTRELLYERGDENVKLIRSEGIRLGTGLASLEVQSSDPAERSWTLTLTDAEGRMLYAYHPGADGDSESLVLSLIGDEQGLFLSSSIDAVRTGPLEFSGLLTIEILPDESGSLEDILAVRLYWD